MFLFNCKSNVSYHTISNLFRNTILRPITDPKFVAFNTDAARLIDLDPQEVDNKKFIEYFS